MRVLCLVSASLLFLVVFATDMAHPVEACKAKVSPKDGAILVSAKNVSGSLLWGRSSNAVHRRFSNESECVVGDRAKKCALGDEGTAARIVPPQFCTLHLRDDVDSCSIFIKRCTPGRRPDLESEVERLRNGLAASAAAFASADLLVRTVAQETGNVPTLPADEAR